jgi:hypothetical protein
MWQHFNVHCRQIYKGTDQNLTELLLVTLIVTSFRSKLLCRDNWR